MNAIRSAFSRALMGLAGIMFAAAQVWGLILLCPPVYRWMEGYVGYLAAPAVLSLAPIIGGLGPFYAGFFMGWWNPMLIIYGGCALAYALFWIAALISPGPPDYP